MGGKGEQETDPEAQRIVDIVSRSARPRIAPRFHYLVAYCLAGPSLLRFDNAAFDTDEPILHVKQVKAIETQILDAIFPKLQPTDPKTGGRLIVPKDAYNVSVQWFGLLHRTPGTP